MIGPVVSDLDKAVYMVRLQGMGDADLELFDTLKDTTENRLLLEKQRALLEEYEANLMTQANIQEFLNEDETASTEEAADSEGDDEGTAG